jgi:hypothetical protein
VTFRAIDRGYTDPVKPNSIANVNTSIGSIPPRSPNRYNNVSIANASALTISPNVYGVPSRPGWIAISDSARLWAIGWRRSIRVRCCGEVMP